MLDRDWTTDLPTWPFPPIEFEEATDEFDAPRRRVRAEAAIAAAVAIGLALGGLAWALWRRRGRASTAPAIVHVPAPVPAPAPTPASEPLWMPQTRAEIDRMVRGVGGWIRLAPHTDDHVLAQMVWSAHWHDVPFPQLGSVAARRGVGEALDLVLGVIAAARAKHIRAVARESVTSDEPTERPGTTAAPVRDSPTPGSFYRVRHGDNLLGDTGIAARALCAAVLDAARRRGQAIAKARGRAQRLASEARAQATYADLIQRGTWNSQHSPELVGAHCSGCRRFIACGRSTVAAGDESAWIRTPGPAVRASSNLRCSENRSAALRWRPDLHCLRFEFLA